MELNIVLTSCGDKIQCERQRLATYTLNKHLKNEDCSLNFHIVNGLKTSNPFFTRYDLVKKLIMSGCENILYCDNDVITVSPVNFADIAPGIYATKEIKRFGKYFNSGIVYYNLNGRDDEYKHYLIESLNNICAYRTCRVSAITFFKLCYPRCTDEDVTDQFNLFRFDKNAYLAYDQPVFNAELSTCLTPFDSKIVDGSGGISPYSKGLCHYWRIRYENNVSDYVQNLLKELDND